MECDVVVVGGGIAGSTLARVLAGAGLEVVVLERQEQYADRVRGELLTLWGVAEAQRLGIYDLLRAAGGHHTEALVDYGDPDDPQEEWIHYAGAVDGVPGMLNLGHPTACAALAAAATETGVKIVFGATHVEVMPGSRPIVSYHDDGEVREVAARLVVGSDGRSSRVRRQAGIELERAAETHMVAGLLVDDLDLDPAIDRVGRGEDVYALSFPQGGGRSRLYLCWGTDEPQRFAGTDATARFLAACADTNIPGSEVFLDATPAGPCRTFPGDDTWTDRPFADGVVLVGDAGGHNNPLIGQGLSLALRDARALSERLLDRAGWDVEVFVDYGAERAERLRKMRFVAQLEAAVQTNFGPDGPALRAAVGRRLSEEPDYAAPVVAELTGPDSLSPEVCTEDFRQRYLAVDA